MKRPPAVPVRLTDTHRDDPATPWFADENFWRIAEPWLFAAPFWTTAAYEADSILEITGKPQDSRVLDLACGPGRVTLQFARRGARVTGVDLNQAYLDKARKSAERSGLDIEWVCADMREFRTDATFDLAVCLYNSFGYFVDDHSDARVLENIHASLKPDGHVVLDHLGREMCEHAISLDPYVETREGLTVEHRAELREDNSILHCVWKITDGKTCDRFVTEQHIYSAEELTGLVKNAGFDTIECFGGYERGVYTPESDRLLLIASK